MIDLRKKDEMVAAIEEILQQEALKGKQHLIDKNKNNKVDPEDFKILRGEKKANEEVEQIEELSKSTLGSYVKGAARDAGASRKLAADFEHDAKSARKQSAKDANTRLADRFKATAMKRHAGIGKAVERLTKEDVGVKTPKTLRQFKEGWEEMMADVKKRAEPKPNGGSGVKQGSRYGGSKQKDKPEQDTDEKK